MLGLGAVALLCALCAPLFVDTVDHTAPKPSAGTVDFASFGPLTRPVELAGEWKLVWRSGAPGPPRGSERRTTVPGRWSDEAINGQTLPGQGAASYRLTIKGLRPGRYALYVPTIYAASRVIANGQELSTWGTPGDSAATTLATVKAHDVIIDVGKAPLELQLDVSSYHQRDDGLEGAPLFGLARPMAQWVALDWLRSFLLLASMLILACYGLVISLFRREDRSWRFFSLAAFAMLPVMAVFSHDNLVFVAFPDMSLLALRAIEYLTVVVGMYGIVAYTDALFPQDSPRLPFRILLGVLVLDFVAYAVAAVVGGTLALSEVAYWSLWVRIGTMIYLIGLVLLATLRRREGAALYLLGITVFFVCMMTTDLIANGFIQQSGASLDLLPLGMLAMLFTQIALMAERWAGAIRSAEDTTSELRQMLDVNVAIASEIHLEPLLRRIVAATSQIIGADRSSLFLFDARTNELWSMVAEGVESREIRFPAGAGLAGDAFTRQAAINVTDAYADPRFNQNVDKATGYRTRAVLTVPVTTRAGHRLGVMQVFNRLDGEPFSETDVSRLTAFGAQAAVAIENATLFSEVAAERNYNDGILRSMSSGVVTLDRDLRFAKLNAAACSILGVAPDMAGAPETQAELAAANPWLVPEIQAVAESGASKTLLDADVMTLNGERIAANISIVPLMAEDEQAGLLILVEDISEGKRLQGAMRRFMTQAVVDQIMGREDELLFGAACQASVLFADIRNFTTLAEKLPPRDTVDMLNTIFTELFEAVAANDGVLDKFIGDAIMAVYGAPLSSGRDPANAVESAVAMIGMIGGINASWKARGFPEIRLGVGIGSGEVVAGTIGSPKRMDYTVIGDSVNLASRLEGITKVYKVGIVVCESTAKAAEGAHPLRELDTIKVRGRTRPERIYQVVTADAPVLPAVMEAYAAGRAAMAAERWDEAVAAFETALAVQPDDGPSILMLARAQILAAAPPEAGWDGIWDSAKAA